MEQFFFGIDIGQRHDPTAIGVIAANEVFLGLNRVTWERETEKQFHLRYLRRMPLGMAYPDMVAGMCSLIAPLAKLGECTMVLDATGVGAPVLDLVRSMRPGCRIVPVIITGGDREHQSDGIWYVPKRDLVIGLQVMFQQRRLQISSELKEAPGLVRELMQMRVAVSQSGHDSYGAAGSGAHDDMVLAVALAGWRARLELPPIWGTRPLF